MKCEVECVFRKKINKYIRLEIQTSEKFVWPHRGAKRRKVQLKIRNDAERFVRISYHTSLPTD